MGHSSVNVSLTYLRGLEIPELTEKDMPMVWNYLLVLLSAAIKSATGSMS